jgi:hypothetical protein
MQHRFHHQEVSLFCIGAQFKQNIQIQQKWYLTFIIWGTGLGKNELNQPVFIDASNGLDVLFLTI